MLEKDILLCNINKISKIFVFDEIDSTNEEAKRQIEIDNSPDYRLILSRYQSKGKGRLGRSFYSPLDTGVYLSLIVPIKKDIENSLLITSAAAVSTADSIMKCSKNKAYIKWVNDIYVNDKKACGILCELVNDINNRPTHMIVGIGINLQSAFPKELEEIAGNIGNVDKNELVSNIVNSLINYYENIEKREFINKYKEYSNVLGKDIFFIEKENTTFAKAIDVNENAALIVMTDNGIKTLSTGEITIRTI